MSKDSLGVIETLIEDQQRVLKAVERLSLSMSAILDTLNGREATRDSPAEDFEKSAAQMKRDEDEAKKVAPKTARKSRTSKSPLFDDDDGAKASDTDWVVETIKLARQRISEGIERPVIKKLIADEGLSTVAQATVEQAKKLHASISALGVKGDEDEF